MGGQYALFGQCTIIVTATPADIRLATRSTHMKSISLALVGAQFLLIALVVSPVSALIRPTITDLPGTLCLLLAVALGVWAMIAMRPGNFSVLPEPVAQGQLVTRGPYRFVRHPMYTAVLLACLGAVLVHATPLKLLWLIALLAVLMAKIRREESMLVERYAEYSTYRQNTNALIPGLY